MTQQTSTNPPNTKEPAVDGIREKTTYDIVQENGQRKYGPPPDWSDAPPPKGCEIFVGKLPRDLYEDEILPLFSKIGPIYEMRLMMEFNGCNRGFAFVMYTNNADAKQAVKELDNHQIRKGRYIGVCKSVDNCRLFVGSIPKTKTKGEILSEMQKVTDSVADVILYSSVFDKSKNRGFAFVEYDSHRAAAMARRKLNTEKISLWGHTIAVDWAVPEPEVDEDTMSKVTVLYVRNLMVNTEEEQIKQVFSSGDPNKVEKVKKLKDFAFVHYKKREDAEEALTTLNGTELEGSTIEVTWAKPADRSSRPRFRHPVNQQVPNYSPFMYGPTGMEHFNPPAPFSHYPGRGQMVPRMRMRGRGRDAAGLRRMRNYGQNYSNHSGAYKHTEVSIPGVPPSYAQYHPGKLSHIPEDGKPYPQEVLFMPVVSTAEGMEPSIAMQGAICGPRFAPPFISSMAAYDTGYYDIIATPPGSMTQY